MVTATPTTATPFSAAIRQATWEAHGGAEQAPWLAALVAGEVSREGYADLVAQHRFAYRALEAAAEAMADDPVAGPFVDPALTRGPALERDLEALLGSDWPDRVAPSAATAAYVARIEEVCHRWPGGFVAHHYTRYLGDLSGGQLLRGTIESVYGIDATCGTAFYDFPLLGDLAEYKAAYRARLDAAPWDEAERARIIEEVLVGYRHNTAVLEQLRP
jgi:heme oxygenase